MSGAGTDEYQRGVRAGLSAAAVLLEEEADECVARAKRLAGTTGTLGQQAALLEHANVLRKQAGEIRDLRVTRGR